MKTREPNATAAGFEVGLEEEEATNAAHGTETVCWLAMEPGRGLWSGRFYAARNSRRSMTADFHRIDVGQGLGSAPRFVAALATFQDPEPAELRCRDLTNDSIEVRVEEDTTEDPAPGGGVALRKSPAIPASPRHGPVEPHDSIVPASRATIPFDGGSK